MAPRKWHNHWHLRQTLSTGSIQPILKELKVKSRKGTTAAPDWQKLSRKDKDLVQKIQNSTITHNRNNVTRTMAYLDFYRRFPEIHWAFLAHMVSRNAGWNMTDLKGEFLTKLLSDEEQKDFFAFLEKANWLIFQDAFPQLLLYENSCRHRSNLFYLLPFLHVSTFMETIWNHFWKEQDRYVLTTALIVNEQNYVEKRVIQNVHYQKNVMQTINFKLQDLLSLNQILFPAVPHMASANLLPSLIGETVHHFDSLHNRISIGKRLYSLLFEDSDHHQQVLNWATRQPHTGSRKDFWPHLFNNVKESYPGMPYQPRIENCLLKPNRHRLYSPALMQAWPDVVHPEAERGDWFHNWKAVHYLMNQPIKEEGKIKKAYCLTLEKLDLAVAAQEKLLSGKRKR